MNSGPVSRLHVHCHHPYFEYCYSDTAECASIEKELQPIAISLKRWTFTIPPKGYMLEHTLNHKCVLAIGFISDK